MAAKTLNESLKQLEALGNERMRAQNSKNGAGDNQFGVRLGDIRKLAAEIKTNHELAIALWETGNIDAQLLAIPTRRIFARRGWSLMTPGQPAPDGA